MRKIQPNQKGMASIVIVAVLATILTLISIGFAKLMDRSVQSSVNKQLSSSATYAAQSGLNDAITYLRANPAVSSTHCGDLLTAGTLGSLANLSGDNSTKYSCLLINQTPQDLLFGQLTPNKSQVIKLITSSTPAKLMFSWQSSDTSKSALPAAASTGLTDETTWSSNGYEPLLRLTLYPIPASASLASVVTNSRTYFLYPTSSASDNLVIHYSDTINFPDGGIIPVRCNASTASVFKSAPGPSYSCNLVVDSFSSYVGAANDYFYARITPVYGQSDVRVQSNDTNGNSLQFVNVQANIDVTAKSGTSSKRLQARVDLSATGGGPGVNIGPSDDAMPEYALQSAKAICKRLAVTPTSTSVDGTFCTKQENLVQPPAPSVVTSPASSITPTTATLSGTINPNGYTTNPCYFQIGTTSGNYNVNSNFGCSGPINGSTPVAKSIVAVLNSNTTYYFRLCAVNAGGTGCGQEQVFSTTAYSPPAVTTNPASNITAAGATLSGTINPNGYTVTSCSFQIGTNPGNYNVNSNFGCSGPINGSSPVAVSTPAVLTSNATWYFRLCAVNTGGTVCTADRSFTTSYLPPVIVSGGFVANQGTIYSANGANRTFNISTTNATSCTINGTSVTTNGTTQALWLYPYTAYTLYCSGPGGNTSAGPITFGYQSSVAEIDDLHNRQQCSFITDTAPDECWTSFVQINLYSGIMSVSLPDANGNWTCHTFTPGGYWNLNGDYLPVVDNYPIVWDAGHDCNGF